MVTPYSLTNHLLVCAKSLIVICYVWRRSAVDACQEGRPMPFYLFQWQYKDPAIKAMVETPQDRLAELR